VFFKNFKRRKIAGEVVDRLWPFFGAVQASTGLSPERFAKDQYIIGFVVGAAGYVARAASDDKLKQTDIGFVITDVVERILGAEGRDRAQQAMQLLKTDGAPDFQRGIANGQKTILAGLGAVGEMQEDPDVQAALAEGDQENVPVLLQIRLFDDYIMDAYGIEDTWTSNN